MEEQHARARRRFDADGSGTISQGEVTAALRCLGVPVRRPRSVTGPAALLHGSLHMCSTPSTVRACQRACADTRSVQAHAHAVRLHFGCRLCARAWPVVSVGDNQPYPITRVRAWPMLLSGGRCARRTARAWSRCLTATPPTTSTTTSSVALCACCRRRARGPPPRDSRSSETCMC